MVSLFSLFGGKKKAKAPSTSGPSSSAASTSSTGPGRRRSRSPVPANPSNNHSSTTPRPVLGTAKSSSSSSGNKLNTLSTSAGNSGTAKFLTIRSRSSAGASALLQKGRSAQRTLTGDSTGGGSGQASAGGSPAWELPSLEFGKGDKDGRLGLDNVGGLPKITKEEWELLQGWKFGMVDINKAWKLLGEGLRISPDPTVVLSTTHTDTPSERYRAALALLILAISPSTLHKLPSLASHYPSADSHLSETWQTRFIDIFNTCTPLEQASLAKWTIQRLDNVGPIIDIAYRQFAQAERNAQYPMDAYNQYTSALAHADLQGVFQVWGDMAARAPVESMLGGKVCLLWAGWFLHAQSEKRKLVAWDELYQSWEGAGKRMQHLFYAWIRHQSVTQTLSLPTRLAQLVEGYPYGSTTDIPPIPASSFSRPVLHLQLISESPIDKIHHEALLRSAVTGMADEDAEVPIRDALLQQGDIDDLVEEDLALLTSGDVESVRSPVIDHPLLDGPTRVTSRSTHSPTPSTGTIRLGALQQEVGKMADSHSTIRGGRAPVARNVSQASRQPSVITPSVSTSTAGSTRQPVDWEDFTKSGFAEEDAALNLSLSPSASRAPQLPPIDTEGKTKPRPISKAYAPAIPTVTSTIIGECIQMVDDVFFAFVRDAQADSAATKAWAPFSLVKLRTPFVTNTDSRSTIEGILVTVQYRAPKPVTPPSIDDSTFNSAPEAPSSPGDDSSRSRFSTFGFKRQSIAGTKRMKSLFGSTRSIPRLDEQARRDEDDARQRGRLGSVTEDPRVLTPADVDEMGMMRVAQPVKADMVSFPAPVAARELQGSIESSPSAAGTNPAALMTASTALMSRQGVPSSGNTLTHASTAAPIILGKPIDSTATLTGAALPVPATSSSLRLADDTAVADWHYVAEGGAHAAFGYHGSNPTYTGKMLRLRKIAAGTDHPDDAVMAVWSKELLPTFIRPELLVETRSVHLVDGDWLRMLLDEAEQHRPEHRVQKGDLNTLAQDIDRPIKGWIMEDLRKAEHAEGERVLSVEIKPKWGFLPDAQHIHPAEAAEIKSTVGRFTLHQHYRGKAATEYNPLDLYSGNHSRMEQALDGLIHDWIESGGKANNLRVFIDGSAVQPPPSAELASSIKTAIIPTLRQSAVLDLLKRLQAGLDSTDISSIAREFSAQHPDKPIFDPASSELADVTPDELRAFVEKYHTAQPSPSEWSVRERIMAYALSAIFKDGSIMVRTVTSASTSGKTATDGLGRGTVKLLDLDLKPLKMQAWYELDEKLWKHWRDTHGNDAVSQGQGVENGAATAVPVNNAVTGEHMRTALPAVPVPSGAMVPAPAEFPISPPVSAKKAKFAGRLHLGSTSAPSAQTVPTVGMNGTMPDHSSAFPPAPSNAVPATPAVEMTLEDVLNLSPAKLRAKPGQTLPIMEESAASSREAVNGHGESLELGGIAPASKAATEDGDVLGRLEDLVIDSPVEPLSGRGRRSGAPSPSPAPEESLSSASTTASRDAGVLPEQTVSADVAERNDGIDKTVSHAPSRDTLRQLPLAPSSMHTQPESAVKYDIDGDNEIYAAPATPTFGTAEELPGSTPDPVSLSSLSLGVSPSTDSDEMGWNTPSADAHQPLASVSEDHMLPTAKNQHESSILMSPDVNHDIATGHEHDLPAAPLGDKNAIEGKLEKVVHEAVVANEGAKRDI